VRGLQYNPLSLLHPQRKGGEKRKGKALPKTKKSFTKNKTKKCHTRMWL
jgi:hypothetical protein